MQKLVITLGTALSLAACSAGPDAEQQQAAAERDMAAIEAVKAAQVVPPEPLNLSAIGFPDIERENLFGAGCNFAPRGGGMGAVAIAQSEAGYLKIDNKVERFVPDAGSPQLPYEAREKYTSIAHSFQLSLQDQTGKRAGLETTDYNGRLVVRDSSDQVVYQADGLVQCGA